MPIGFTFDKIRALDMTARLANREPLPIPENCNDGLMLAGAHELYATLEYVSTLIARVVHDDYDAGHGPRIVAEVGYDGGEIVLNCGAGFKAFEGPDVSPHYRLKPQVGSDN